jgi:hypothetical protein
MMLNKNCLFTTRHSVSQYRTTARRTDPLRREREREKERERDRKKERERERERDRERERKREREECSKKS